MKSITCDILIIGAGPAGSSAAMSAAQKGMDALVLEQRAVIGMPVQCAEYIPAPLMGQLNLGTGFVVQKVTGMKTILPDGSARDMAAPGFMIHRDRFDQTLAEEARKRGAGFFLSTKALALTDDRHVVIKNDAGETSVICPRIIIGADGPRSRTTLWCGAPDRKLLPAAQYHMALCSPMNHTEIYLSPRFYGGYAWLFPKGDSANVGLGIKRNDSNPHRLHALLSTFVEQLKKEGKIKGGPLGATAGWIPTKPLESAVYDNILLAGDAAGHTHPITGAGVFTAVSCGRMAGSWAAEAIMNDDLGILAKYDDEWQDLFGHTLNRAHEKRQLMEREWDRFHQVIKSCWVGFREYYQSDPP